MSNYHISVISLDDGNTFLNNNNFINTFDIDIHGVNGNNLSARLYFNMMFSARQRIISPAELGTRLSHLNVLENFLSTKAEFCVVFEEDVFIQKEKFMKLLEFLALDKANIDFIHLGGLDGLSEKYIFDRFVKNDDSSVMPEFLLKILWRACGYCVSRNAAKAIIERQKKYNCVADDWSVLLSGCNLRMGYFPCVRHPIELSDSKLEEDRNSLQGLRDQYGSRLTRLLYFMGAYVWVLTRSKPL